MICLQNFAESGSYLLDVTGPSVAIFVARLVLSTAYTCVTGSLALVTIALAKKTKNNRSVKQWGSKFVNYFMWL